jgi:hypothetical protein
MFSDDDDPVVGSDRMRRMLALWRTDPARVIGLHGRRFEFQVYGCLVVRIVDIHTMHVYIRNTNS